MSFDHHLTDAGGKVSFGNHIHTFFGSWDIFFAYRIAHFHNSFGASFLVGRDATKGHFVEDDACFTAFDRAFHPKEIVAVLLDIKHVRHSEFNA